MALRALTAQAFTRSAGALGLDGAIYIFQVEPGGLGEGAGLRVGDILVSLAGQPLRDMDALQAALATAPTGEPFQLELLRLGADGVFSRLSVEVGGQPLGVGMMPI